MPFKHNAARRHRIPRARYRVTNWPAYEAGLRRRGDLTLWLDEAALAGWAAPKRSRPGGQRRYSEPAIELVLTLWLVFRLAQRQAEAFSRSVLRLLGLALPIPDHTTLSRCGRAIAGRQPRVQASAGPIHLVLDSTGLELFGQGIWDAEMHGRTRRQWRKLQLAVDACTGEIAAHVLTGGHADDVAQVPALLGQVEGVIASVTAEVVVDRQQGAVAQVALSAAPGIERAVYQAPGQAVRLFLCGAVLLHHAPQRQLDGVAVGRHRQARRPGAGGRCC